MKELEQYIKSYMNIFLESWRNDVLSSDNMITKPLTLSQIESLIENTELIDPENDDIKILYDPDDPTLFTEAKQFSDIIDLILKAKNGEIFWADRIQMFINRKWKLYEDFKKNVKPFYVFKFDFSNVDMMSEIIRTYMNAADDYVVKSFAERWISELKQSAAAYTHSDETTFKAFFINVNPDHTAEKTTIIHEFTHYLQNVMKIYKIEDDIEVDRSKLKFLRLSEDEQESLSKILSKNEVWPYVNEVVEVLSDIYKDYKKLSSDLTPGFFAEYVMSKLTTKDIYTTDLYKEIAKRMPNYADALYVFIACIVLDIQKAEIVETLKEELTDGD